MSSTLWLPDGTSPSLSEACPPVRPQPKNIAGTSLVVQGIRIRLPVQGTQVQALLWEDPHALQQLILHATTTDPML